MTRLLAKPWLWAFAAAGAVWLATVLFTGGLGGGGVLTAAFTFATFYVIVGLGQMFVITLGPGNVDLSIPATITLAGAVATKVMDTQDSAILLGLLVALAIGVLVGCFRPPSVPHGTSRLRLAARADLSDDDVALAVKVVSSAISAGLPG